MKELLLQIVEENDQILGSPIPVVQFAEVTAQAVSVDLYFWVRTLKDTGQVKSDVVYGIHEVFQRENIPFSIPMQKVCVDSETKPDIPGSTSSE